MIFLELSAIELFSLDEYQLKNMSWKLFCYTEVLFPMAKLILLHIVVVLHNTHQNGLIGQWEEGCQYALNNLF